MVAGGGGAGKGAGEVPDGPAKHGGVDTKYYDNREVIESFTPIRLSLEDEVDLFGSDKVRGRRGGSWPTPTLTNNDGPAGAARSVCAARAPPRPRNRATRIWRR